MRVCPRHGSWSRLFLSRSISCLIRFPKGKLVLTGMMGSDLTDWLFFFFFPRDCLVNWLADGLVGCWHAGSHGWQNEGLTGWLMSDNYWLTEWQLAAYTMCEINELFLLPAEPRKTSSDYGFWPWVNCKSVSSPVSCTSVQYWSSQEVQPSSQLKDKSYNLLYFSYCQKIAWKTASCFMCRYNKYCQCGQSMT